MVHAFNRSTSLQSEFQDSRAVTQRNPVSKTNTNKEEGEDGSCARRRSMLRSRSSKCKAMVGRRQQEVVEDGTGRPFRLQTRPMQKGQEGPQRR